MLANFSEHDSSVLDAHGFGVVSLAYFLHLYFEPSIGGRRRREVWQTRENNFWLEIISWEIKSSLPLLILGEMEEEGARSIGEGGGDKLLQLLADVEEAAEEVAF